jgi:hypothetical protein
MANWFEGKLAMLFDLCPRNTTFPARSTKARLASSMICTGGEVEVVLIERLDRTACQPVSPPSQGHSTRPKNESQAGGQFPIVLQYRPHD